MFVYLRLHPNLFNEVKSLKPEPEKPLKQSPSEDDSLEWRQYCLDPLYTNFNQVIQSMENTSVANATNNSILDYSNLVISSIKAKNNYQRLMPPGQGVAKPGHTLQSLHSSNPSTSTLQTELLPI